MLACPRISCTTFIGWPASSSIVAAVCRQSYSRMAGSFNRWSIGVQAYLLIPSARQGSPRPFFVWMQSDLGPRAAPKDLFIRSLSVLPAPPLHSGYRHDVQRGGHPVPDLVMR